MQKALLLMQPVKKLKPLTNKTRTKSKNKTRTKSKNKMVKRKITKYSRKNKYKLK